jgi:parallel beta-helix repeat protein
MVWPVLAGLALLVGPAWGQAVVYVHAGASGAGDGSSWADAFTSVQAGLRAADPGDQVWVAGGRYVENIMLVNRVALYGGFAGDEDPATFDLAERDLAANETILDGNQGLSVVGASISVYEETRIDGFTITTGETGLCLEYCWFLTVANNTITGNGGGTYGAGLHLVWSHSTITNNTITGNSTGFDGGGVFVWGSSPTIVNNTITGNSAMHSGGGVCVAASSSATIANNTITGNSAMFGGGGVCVTSSSSPTIVNNTIAGNIAGREGGGLCLGNCSATIANTIVAFNSSGVHVEDGGDTILRHNCVYDNAAYDYSGLDDPTGTDGNISEDPLFVLTPGPGPDGEWGTEDDELGDARLSAGSPCIDAGDNAYVPEFVTTDLDGKPRFVDGSGDGGHGCVRVPVPAWRLELRRRCERV